MAGTGWFGSRSNDAENCNRHAGIAGPIEEKGRECMGIEPTQHYPEDSANNAAGGAKSGALAVEKPTIDPALAAILDAWPTLPEPIKAAIRALVGSVAGPS
jgi:hypothetical protein